MPAAVPAGRYLPEWPLPAYAYVPGQAPHPQRDPDGHSYGATEPEVTAIPPGRWRDCPAFLYGIDLFNHGYFWEAHESWEALWRAYPAGSPPAVFLEALIKLAAAGVKAREGRPRGVARHGTKAAALLARLPADAPLFGLQPRALAAVARGLRDGDSTLAVTGLHLRPE